MRAIILLGRYTANTFEEPHVLYCGLDGIKSQQAAADACASGKYAKGGQILELRNPSGRPLAVVPIVPKLKVPTPVGPSVPTAPAVPEVPNSAPPAGQDDPVIPKAPTSPKQPKTKK